MSSSLAGTVVPAEAGQASTSESLREIILSVRGMTCGSCVQRVQDALQGLEGVARAEVDLAAGDARVRYDPARVGSEAICDTVRRVGYQAAEVASTTVPAAQMGMVANQSQRIPILPVVVGLVGAALLAGLYLGIVTLAQGWDHALELFATDWYFVLAIMAGFGIQVGLFTYVRTGLAAGHGSGSATAATGVGTGTSTASMLACCAHHLTDILPLVGLSGAAIFLTDYRVPFMLLGIATNLVGIVVMLRLIRKLRRGVCATNRLGYDEAHT